MAQVSLPSLPQGDEFEEYISAFFQCGGYHVDRRLIDRGEDEILELDIIITDYQTDRSPDIRLLEIKSGTWGFSDIFKVKGWMHYLNLTDGKFIVRIDKKNLEFFKLKAKPLGIDVICIPNLDKTQAVLEPFTTLTNCGGTEIRLWRFSYWCERNLIKRLNALKKQDRNAKRYSALAAYFYLVNSKTFFTDNIISRVEELYRTFQRYPNVSAKSANEMLGNPFEADYESIPKKIYEQTYYSCALNDLAVSCLIEHRARLAILKNAIDYILYKKAGDRTKTDAMDSITIRGQTHEWSRLDFLPKAFRDGLAEIGEEPFYFRYPVFWQWFLWYFGGFILTDLEDKEYELMSRCTGIPVAEIPNALLAYEKLFPMSQGWFTDLGSKSKVRKIKMMSVPFMGVGANARRIAYSESRKFDDIPTGGQFTVSDLIRWNSVAVEVLS